jgi:hypothetical protein
VGSGGAPWWLSIVTALLAGGFALLGVRWTQRHAAEQRRLDRLEDHRAEQREAVMEVLATGFEWGRRANVVATRAAQEDESTLTKSSEFESYRSLAEVHRRALLTARLVVRDEQVHSHVKSLSRSAEGVPRRVRRVILARSGVDGRADVARHEARAAIVAHGEALHELERLTRDRMVDDPQEVRRWWWQRVQLPRPGRRRPPAPDAEAA